MPPLLAKNSPPGQTRFDCHDPEGPPKRHSRHRHGNWRIRPDVFHFSLRNDRGDNSRLFRLEKIDRPGLQQLRHGRKKQGGK